MKENIDFKLNFTLYQGFAEKHLKKVDSKTGKEDYFIRLVFPTINECINLYRNVFMEPERQHLRFIPCPNTKNKVFISGNNNSHEILFGTMRQIIEQYFRSIVKDYAVLRVKIVSVYYNGYFIANDNLPLLDIQLEVFDIPKKNLNYLRLYYSALFCNNRLTVLSDGG